MIVNFLIKLFFMGIVNFYVLRLKYLKKKGNYSYKIEKNMIFLLRSLLFMYFFN